MIGPQLERGLLLRSVGGPVVDASDAALVAADVIDHGLDHVGRDAQLGHAGDGGSPQVVNAPRLGSLHQIVDLKLGLAKPTDRRDARCGEHEIGEPTRRGTDAMMSLATLGKNN